MKTSSNAWISALALPLAAALSPMARGDTALLSVGDASIEVTLPRGELSVSPQQLTVWIETAARTVESYYAGFPVELVRLQLEPTPGRFMRGTTWSGSVPFIRVMIGSRIGQAELDADWRLTHEMIHLSVPELGEGHDWLHEGIATYVEPIARAQFGTVAPEEVWRRFIEGMPLGLAGIDAGGLSNSGGWAGTYWGGALFCLLADIAIREQSENRSGLQDALIALRRSGASITETWEVDRTLAVADGAIGGRTLQDLYARMTREPPQVDLPRLWLSLGAKLENGTVRFDDAAPKAAIRRAITARRE